MVMSGRPLASYPTLAVDSQPLASRATTVKVTCPFCRAWNVTDASYNELVISALSALHWNCAYSDAFVTEAVAGHEPVPSAITGGAGMRVGRVTLLCAAQEDEPFCARTCTTTALPLPSAWKLTRVVPCP